MGAEGRGTDLSAHAPFLEAKAAGAYFGSVYFRNGSEPYMSIAAGESEPGTGVTVAEVNLTSA